MRTGTERFLKQGLRDMIGQFATSKAGHDKGTLYVIVAEEGRFAYLSDGRLKPPERPKKKQTKHLQPINGFVDGELLGRLRENRTVYAEEIRYALDQYRKRQMQ